MIGQSLDHHGHHDVAGNLYHGVLYYYSLHKINILSSFPVVKEGEMSPCLDCNYHFDTPRNLFHGWLHYHPMVDGHICSSQTGTTDWETGPCLLYHHHNVAANNQYLDGLYFHPLPVCNGLSPNPSKAICDISSGQSASKTRPHIVMVGAVF